MTIPSETMDATRFLSNRSRHSSKPVRYVHNTAFVGRTAHARAAKMKALLRSHLQESLSKVES